MSRNSICCRNTDYTYSGIAVAPHIQTKRNLIDTCRHMCYGYLVCAIYIHIYIGKMRTKHRRILTNSNTIHDATANPKWLQKITLTLYSNMHFHSAPHARTAVHIGWAASKIKFQTRIFNNIKWNESWIHLKTPCHTRSHPFALYWPSHPFIAIPLLPRFVC